MKKLLIPLLLIILWAANVYALGPALQACAGAGGSAACTDTIKDSNTTDNATRNVDSAAYIYISSDWVAKSNYDLSKVVLKLSKYGSPTANATVRIYGESSSAPNALLGESAAIASSTFTTDGAEYIFSFASAIGIIEGDHYWIIVWVNGAFDATNYIKIHYDNSTANGGHGIGRYTTSYAGLDSSAQFYFKTVACE